MIKAIIVFLIMSALIIGIFLSPWLVKQWQIHLTRKPFPAHWTRIIEQKVPIYSYLPPHLRQRLQGHIQIFLALKQFIGCGGLQVTEEMKVIIATQACLLLLNERGKYFPKLQSILVYPNAYVIKNTSSVSTHIVEEKQEVRLGESWSRDQLVLSWEQIEQDLLYANDGHNLILHEFAHQLDSEDGHANGVPRLPKKSDYATWSSIMGTEYQQLCEDVSRGRKTTLYAYGATAPAEFFSVATETFFEKPHALLKKHSELYNILRNYYQLDPVQWS